MKTNCAVVIGYMIADTMILALYWQQNGEIFYILHHLSAIIAFMFLIVCALFNPNNYYPYHITYMMCNIQTCMQLIKLFTLTCKQQMKLEQSQLCYTDAHFFGTSTYEMLFGCQQTTGCLCWFANFRLIAEFSTPFVNQRWVTSAPQFLFQLCAYTCSRWSN